MKVKNLEDLNKAYEQVQAKLLDVTQKKFPWENKEAYTLWLIQTFEYVRYSTRMLAITAGKFPLEKTHYSSRFVAHAAEERGHDKLLINDVKALGKDITSFDSSSAAKAFHYSFYYWSFMGNPMGIFGLLLAVEGFAALNLPTIHKRCVEKYGSKATSFLKVHAEEDDGHLSKIFQTIKDASPDDLQVITDGMLFYCDSYAHIYEDIIAKTGSASNSFQKVA